ncbi:hypothetical protein D6825_03790, partial [Candidatus Woesearchaeota archaeon]
MCILLAKGTEKGIIVGMNRDEKPSRAHKHYATGELFYPADVERGGTWLAISRKTGDIAALLNKGLFSGNRSRGEVPLRILREGRLDSDLCGYAPFEVFWYKHKERTVRVAEWNGYVLSWRKEGLHYVMASSRYNIESQKEMVAASFFCDVDDAYSFREALRSHFPKKGFVSTCMHGGITQSIAST